MSQMNTESKNQANIYEVYALRVGANGNRTVRESFMYDACCGDPNALMPLDYCFWVIKKDDFVVVVDTCFQPETASKRNREMFRHPQESLELMGINPEDVTDVIITHLHWDHAGNLPLFPNARVHLQAEELKFCTGPDMAHHAINKTYEVDDVLTAIKHLYKGRLCLHSGMAELFPNIQIYPVGGHTPGSQVVRVLTKRGWIVLASDSAHLWANIRLRSPFPILDNLSKTLEAYQKIEELSDGPDHIIPGHDPLVTQTFVRWNEDPHIVCLHEIPKTTDMKIAPWL